MIRYTLLFILAPMTASWANTQPTFQSILNKQMQVCPEYPCVCLFPSLPCATSIHVDHSQCAKHWMAVALARWAYVPTSCLYDTQTDHRLLYSLISEWSSHLFSHKTRNSGVISACFLSLTTNPYSASLQLSKNPENDPEARAWANGLRTWMVMPRARMRDWREKTEGGQASRRACPHTGCSHGNQGSGLPGSPRIVELSLEFCCLRKGRGEPLPPISSFVVMFALWSLNSLTSGLWAHGYKAGSQVYHRSKPKGCVELWGCSQATSAQIL